MSAIKLVSDKTLSVKSNVFLGCTTTEHGGAIFQDYASSCLYVSHCFFLLCKASKYSGGICAMKSAETSIEYSCFLENEAKSAPAFILYANSHALLKGSFKYVSVISRPSDHSTSFGGRTKAVFSFLNESNFRPNGAHFFFCLTCNEYPQMKMSYFILYNNTATNALFGLYFNNLTIFNTQIISCASGSISQFYSDSYIKSKMRNCIIKDCSITKNGDNEIYDCLIDKQINGYSGQTTSFSLVTLYINECFNTAQKCSCRIRNSRNIDLSFILFVIIIS